MMGFWFFAGIMILLASAFVLVPVFRFRPPQAPESAIRREKNIDLYRQRLDELRNDLDLNVIQPDEFREMETEIKRAFLSDMPVGQDEVHTGRPLTLHDRLLPLACLIVTLFLGIKLYAHVGAADEMIIPELIQQVNNPESQARQESDFRKLARLLDQRGRKRPDDMMNAYMLGTLYLRLQKYQDAASVFSMMEEKLDNPADRMMILKLLARAESLQKSPHGEMLTQVSPHASPHTSPHGQGQEPVSQGIQVHVEIDEAIRGQIKDGMRLFVFARDPEKNAPLAVGTYDINAIPEIITLDDSMAMMPQFNISSAQSLYIGARISRQAIASSGDFQIMTDVFSPEEHSGLISLTIAQAIP